MKVRGVLLAIVAASVALAGCASDDDLDGDTQSLDTGVDQESFSLRTGKGAIAGLLVDDRFRPIQLTDAVETEFQAEGFILLQETGQRVKTDANGEFGFVDLEPGTYTLRTTASGHEATPVKIRVAEGIFAEVSIVARRIVSEGSFILTDEYSAFIPCAAAWPSIAVTSAIVFGCLDASGESYRPGASGINYTGIEGITFMVAEYVVDEPGYFTMQVRGGDGVYADVNTDGGLYGRNVIANAEEVYDWPGNRDPWTNSQNFESIIFYRGEHQLPTGDRVGVATSIRGQFILSLFVGQPEVDLAAYQLLSEETDLQ